MNGRDVAQMIAQLFHEKNCRLDVFYNLAIKTDFDKIGLLKLFYQKATIICLKISKLLNHHCPVVNVEINLMDEILIWLMV
jgi:hypothetical protein